MVAIAVARPAPVASPSRWNAAILRAVAEGVRVVQLATSGVWVATSGTDTGRGYVVTPLGCECPAAAHGDPVCKHRAALRLELGLLPAAAPVVHHCTHCRDEIDNQTSIEVGLCWSCENDWAWSADDMYPTR